MDDYTTLWQNYLFGSFGEKVIVRTFKTIEPEINLADIWCNVNSLHSWAVFWQSFKSLLQNFIPFKLQVKLNLRFL